ncbi:MAG: calcium/sodium antiporter [Ilumatobacteraceae bacterium]
MTLWILVRIVIGLVMLIAGAEFLVRGAASIASRLGISAVAIGLTVVAFGTSAPELAVSVGSALRGEAEVALGNVIGSNIANILLILGLSAVFGGLTIASRVVRLDLPLVMIASTVVLLMSLDSSISRIDGVILFAGIIAYTAWLLRASRRESKDMLVESASAVAEIEGGSADDPVVGLVAYLVGGFVMLVVGAQVLVGAATEFATNAGVSKMVVGLTVVAIGTSLPELATSMVAAYRGERDIAVGNVVGSNMFNLLSVLGAAGIFAKNGVAVADSSLTIDYPVMIAATVVLLPIFWNGFAIKRWEGLLLVGFYALYIVFLALDATDHSATEWVGPAALVAAPLAILSFSVAGFQGWRQHRGVARGQ